MDFEPLKKSKLTQTELANIFEVSRVTINKWLGPTPPKLHKLHRGSVERKVAIIDQAVSENKLPLPKGMPRHLRLACALAVVNDVSA